MRKIRLILFLVVLTVIPVLAQVSGKMNYQAVIRNTSGELVTNQNLGVKISILNETSNGDVLYSETHSLSTDAYGQIAIVVGDGTEILGDFSSIKWSIDDKYLKIEVDINGGTSYSPIGTSQILSVPYALYANNSDSAKVAGIAYRAYTSDIANFADSSRIAAMAYTTNIAGSASTSDIANFADSARVAATAYSADFANISDSARVAGIAYTADFANSANNANTADAADFADSARVAGMAYTAGVADALGSVGVYSTNTDTLFVVKDHDGNVVFVVFPDGAQLVVDESAKGKVGGFAVSGRSPSKDVFTDYIRVTSDSTIIFIDNEPAKGKVGGFAVSGRSPSKEIGNYFNVSGDNTPIIINPSESRVVWFPRKEAFWAGRVLIEHPDSVGLNSLAIGYEAIAKGNNSQSLGYQTRARGNFSTAIGYRTQANGVGCFAVGGEERGVDGIATGVNTIADGTASFALGLGANASGIANTAIGLRSSATGNFASTAFGVFASATANRATAIGFGSVASAEQSLAIGVSDTASAYNSMAMGVGSKASGIAAIALGTFVEANITGSFVVGQLNDPFGTTDLWNTSDPIFVVGNGIFGIPGVLSTAVKSNAFTILKNGNVGVGIDSPKRTVHIKDVMRLEPRLTAPLSPSAGDIYYDGSTNTLKVHNGTEWKTVSWTP